MKKKSCNKIYIYCFRCGYESVSSPVRQRPLLEEVDFQKRSELIGESVYFLKKCPVCGQSGIGLTGMTEETTAERVVLRSVIHNLYLIYGRER